jgi:hypothetical protein
MSESLRERIAALVDQCEPPEDTADRILALLADPEPPSDQSLLVALHDGGAVAVDSAAYARGLASSEQERAELQRRLEVAGSRISELFAATQRNPAWAAAEEARARADQAEAKLAAIGEALAWGSETRIDLSYGTIWEAETCRELAEAADSAPASIIQALLSAHAASKAGSR